MDKVIEYDSFVIVEKPQKTYKGFYKDGKPYSGYFSKGNIEFPRVDYYENGVLTFQYSLDIYQMALGESDEEGDDLQESQEKVMTTEEYEAYIKDLYKPKLNIKSIYKEGEIIEGYEYGELPSGIFSMKIVNQKTTELNIDVFGMHYYQRTSIVLIEDVIIIISPTSATPGENLEIRLLEENKSWIASYVIDGKEIGSKYFLKGEFENMPANCTLFLYDQNNNIYSYGISGFREHSAELDLIDVSNIYFENPEIFVTKDAYVVFNDFIDAAIREVQREEGTYPEEPEIYRGYLVTGNKGDIDNGIRFFEKGTSSYYLEYKEGSEVKNEKVNHAKFQQVFKEYLNNAREN